MPENYYTSQAVAKRLGVAIHDLWMLAKKIPGRLQPVPGKTPWSEEAVQAMAAEALPSLGNVANAEKNAPQPALQLPPPAKVDVIEVEVYRSKEHGVLNRHVVLALPLDQEKKDRPWTVRVVDNGNYVIGMKFHARVDGDHLGTAWCTRTNSEAPAPRSRGRL